MREFIVFTHILYQKLLNISSCYYKHDNFILAPWRVLVLIQVGVAIREKSRGHRASRDFIQEFAPPYKASDTEAAEQCFEPIFAQVMIYKISKS